MEGVFAFQRTGASVSLTTTTQVGGVSATLTIAPSGVVEIANTSATISAAFGFADAGAAAAPTAAATMRTIPPMAVLHERLPQGSSYVSAIALAGGAPVIVFTPGAPNG